MLALLIGVASAGYLTDLGAPIDLDLPGRHARPFVTEDGAWWLGFGRSGSFHAVPLADDFSTGGAASTTLVPGDGRFVDHNFVPCEGGGFLHVASGETTALDDTAWASFVSRDLQWRGTLTLIDGDPHYTTNDTPAVCGAAGWVAGFATEGDGTEDGQPGNELVAFDATAFGGGGVPTHHDATDAMRMPGTALVWHGAPGHLLSIGLQPPVRVRITTYDARLEPVAAADRLLALDPALEAYWGQSAVEVEGGVLLAHMVRDPVAGFAQDTGDVALSLLGPELELLETVVLTHHTAPDGGMRPGLAVSGEQVVVGYDVGGALHTVTARIDRAAIVALQVTEPDVADSADPATDTGATGGGPTVRADPSPADEGCATAPFGGSMGLVLLALVRRRRP